MAARAARLSGLAAAYKAGRDALAATPLVPRAVEQAVGKLAHALVEEVKAGGELVLTVEAGNVTVEGAPLPMGDALAAPLARDGIRSITFGARLPLEEATKVAHQWIHTSVGPHGTEGVASAVWDIDKAHVVLSLHPPARCLGEGALLEAERLFRDWTTTPALPPSETILLSDERAVPTLRALEALNLEPEAGVVDIDQWRRDLDTLTRALTNPRGNCEEHLALAVVRAGDRASSQAELNALFAVVDRLVSRLAHEHHFAAAVDVFRLASSSGIHTQGGYAVLERFRAGLSSGGFLATLVQSLNDAGAAPEALQGLRHMGAGAAKSLAQLPGLTDEGRRRLNAVLAELEGDAARNATQQAAATAAASLDRLKELPAAEALAVLKKAVASPDHAVRRHALEVMTQSHAAQLAEALRQRLTDTHADVRALALKHVADLEDPTAVPALVTLLHKASLPPAERKAVYGVLARVGGPKAAAALVEELQKQTDVTVRVAAAQALGGVDHPKVREALDAEAGRLLGNAELKKACKEALARLGGAK
ncbi:MAG: ERAP1-like C-terminal domain-containing protein [Myxococcota bacterium]